MQLQGKKAMLPAGAFVVVNQLGGFYAVNVMNKMKTLPSNPVLVPFAFLDCFANLTRFTKFFRFFL